MMTRARLEIINPSNKRISIEKIIIGECLTFIYDCIRPLIEKLEAILIRNGYVETSNSFSFKVFDAYYCSGHKWESYNQMYSITTSINQTKV